jgi:hypothetical protein
MKDVAEFGDIKGFVRHARTVALNAVPVNQESENEPMGVQPDELKAKSSLEVMRKLQPYSGMQVKVGGISAILQVNEWTTMPDVKEEGYVKVDFRYATTVQLVPVEIQAIIDTLVFFPIA